MKDLVLAVVMLASVGSPAGAQSYPSRSIQAIVPAVAGGSIDILARSAAALLTEQLGRPVVVENRGGAAAIVGSDFVAKSRPDGYTIGVIPDPVFTIYPHLYSKLPFSLTDFAPITFGASTTLGIFAHQSVSANTLTELIELAKAKPGSLSFGTPGIGTPMHLAGELLQQKAGIKLVHVPYRGGGQAVNDVVGGQIPLLIGALAPMLPFVRSANLKAIAITDSRRSPLAPDIPTVAEAGLTGFEVNTWFGFFAPAGTPSAIVDRLNRETVQALQSPNLTTGMFKLGLDVAAGSPQAALERIDRDSHTWMPVIRSIGLRLDQ